MSLSLYGTRRISPVCFLEKQQGCRRLGAIGNQQDPVDVLAQDNAPVWKTSKLLWTLSLQMCMNILSDH